jgi:ABC-type multidrug transport system fused ATPase/permease subunit
LIPPFFEVFGYSGRAISLVWETNRKLSIFMAVLTLAAGILPAIIAYVGKLIIDSILLAAESGTQADQLQTLYYVTIEGAIVALNSAVHRAQSVAQSLLRAQLGQRVNEIILEKALLLDLAHFEDPEFYDKMTRARREASTRPLSLVLHTFGLLQNGISLVSYSGLLFQFSPIAVGILFLAGIPAFVVETRFSARTFRLFKWRTPERREQAYLEMAIAREDFAKETLLFGTGSHFLTRYKKIFLRLYGEDRKLVLSGGFWGYLLTLLSTIAFYLVYGWIAVWTILKRITLGEMTMYLLVFKQGQSAFAAILSAVGNMYEDNLYLSNLYEFLEQETSVRSGTEEMGPTPDAGLSFEKVTFTYPDAKTPAIKEISFTLKQGDKLALVGANGSGKTTIVKLLTRLYQPDSGQIFLDGLPLEDWNLTTLRKRIGVIFQDFVRYQLTVGENIGVGDVPQIESKTRQIRAAEKGMAAPFITTLPHTYDTRLGRWFRSGQELSLGQWQKVALSRAFMREEADILILDEPTAAMDAEAEAQIFERFKQMTPTQKAIVISHRFSTVRMADHILVLSEGQIIERGSHDILMELGGTYAKLFALQAQGYH